MIELDLSDFGKNLEPEVKQKLEEYFYTLVDLGFEDNPYRHKRYALECALKQHALTDGLYNGLADKHGLDAEFLKYAFNLDFPQGQDQYIEERDEFSSLHAPILFKAHRTFFEISDNIAFPLDDDSTGIKRTNSRFCNENNLQDFLPALNASLQNILQTEDQQFGFQAEYQSILSEGLAHSFWSIDHEFDSKLNCVRPFNPNTQQVAIYPQRSNPKRSNRLRYFDTEYDLIVGRDDFDEELISVIKPRLNMRDQNANNDTRSMLSQEVSPGTDSDVAFNKVRVYKLVCPSITLELDGELYVASDVVVYGLVAPEFIDENFENRPFYILGIEQNVSELESGLYLGSVVPSNGDEFYNEGLFYPYLEHQKSANAFLSAAVRTATYFAQSPIVKEQNVLGGINEEEEEGQVGIYPFKEMRGKCYPYFDASVMNAVPPSMEMVRSIEAEVMRGIGVTETMQGVANAGRQTAVEMLRVSAGGDIKPMRITARFIRSILIPSRFVRLTERVRMLKEQVMGDIAKAQEAISDVETAEQLPEDQLLEIVLENNDLFKQTLDFSGLDVEYERFYRKRQKEIIENERILQRQQALAQEVLSLTHLANSPIPPFNPTMVPPATVQNEQGVPVGTVPPTPEQIAQFKMMYEQQETQRRQEAAKRAGELELQVKEMVLSVQPVVEIPPPSNAMYFKMLVEDLKQGDLRFAGAFAVFNKMAENGTLDRLLNFIAILPPEDAKKIDFEKFFTLVTRGENIRPSEIMKDTDKLEREEQLQRAEAEAQRQKIDVLLKNPGSQDPDPPREE